MSNRKLAMPAVIRPEHAFAFNVGQMLIDNMGEDADPVTARDMSLAKRVWGVLCHHYPGHQWLVAASHHQGGIFIDMPMFTTWRYFIRLQDIDGDPGLKAVVRAGGELLERWRMPRSNFSVADLVAAHERFRPDITRSWDPPE